jgi:mannose-1-phosphate guanylyltransferase
MMPADHKIADNRHFAEVVKVDAVQAQAGHLVTFGIIPTKAAI